MPPLQWSQITRDVKIPIIEFLDYETRCNLRLCSRSDKQVVDLAKKFRVGKLKIVEVRSHSGDEKKILIVLDNFTIKFISRDSGTEVKRGWNNEVVEEWSEMKQEDRLELTRRFLDEQLNRIVAESIHIQDIHIDPSENWRLNCKNLELGLLGNELRYHNWLQITSTPLKKLVIFGHCDDLPITMNILRTSQSLRIRTKVNLSDEQLEQIIAPDLAVCSRHLSLQGVRKRLGVYLKTAKSTDRIELTVLLDQGVEIRNVIPEGVEWKEDPERSQIYGFCAKLTTEDNDVQKTWKFICWPLNDEEVRVSIEEWPQPEPPRKWYKSFLIGCLNHLVFGFMLYLWNQVLLFWIRLDAL